MGKISDELREFADAEVLSAIQISDLKHMVKRIDAEMVELPKDADGVPIHVGDTVYGCISGRKSQATGLRLEDAWVILTNHGFGEPHIFTHTRPDSLESIADELEAAKGWRDQNGEYSCIVSSVSTKTLGDWADRIRKLAKEQTNE